MAHWELGIFLMNGFFSSPMGSAYSHPFSHEPSWNLNVERLLRKRNQARRVDDKEHAAVLVIALGFAYLVAGAWPLWTQMYPWQWQQIIANYGNLLVLPLYVGGVIAFFTGAVSLYIHSKIYHENLKSP